VREIRLGFRRLSAQPLISAVCIVALACTIASVAAGYATISAVTLRPIPVPALDRVAILAARTNSGNRASNTASAALEEVHPYAALQLARSSGAFADVGAAGRMRGTVALTVPAQGASEGIACFVSHNLFGVLGLRLPLGRPFLQSEDRAGAPVSAVLSHGAWRRLFGAHPSAIGTTISVNGDPVTVVGVTPPDFRGLNLAAPPDIYLPLSSVGAVAPEGNYLDDNKSGASPTAWLTVVLRFQDGDRLGDAAARLAAHPLAASTSRRLELMSLTTSTLPAAARPAMAQFTRLILASLGLLLLIGSGTIGALLLVRTEARQDEFAIRTALGASTLSLFRSIAVEIMCLTTAAMLLALFLCRWLLDSLGAFQLPGGINLQQLRLTLGAREVFVVVTAAVAAAILVAAIAGLSVMSTRRTVESLRSRTGATASRGRRRTRSTLFVAQVAISMMLLSAAGLFVRSAVAALALNSGYDTAHLLTGNVAPASRGYTEATADGFFVRLHEQLKNSPAIGASATTVLIGAMVPPGKLLVDNQSYELPSAISIVAVDDSFFQTAGIRIRNGRALATADTTGAPLVGVASESLAKWLSAARPPLGSGIAMPFRQNGQPAARVEVVGIATDMIRNVTALEPLVLYVPLRQHVAPITRGLVVRTRTTADAARREVAAAIRTVDSRAIPPRLTTIDEQLATQMSAQRLGAAVLGALGVLATMLTVIGTYVLARAAAVTRMREMAIRAALGASRRSLGGLILNDTGRLVLIGLLLGLFAAWWATNFVSFLLFDVSPMDPVTLGAVCLLIAVMTVAVSIRPALQAARVNLTAFLNSD